MNPPSAPYNYFQIWNLIPGSLLPPSWYSSSISCDLAWDPACLVPASGDLLAASSILNITMAETAYERQD